MVSRKKTEADLAVEILLENQESMFYEALLKEIAARMGRDQKISTLVPIFSRLNLDHRLQYQGDGFWYLDPKRVKGKD
ncbi:MAG: DNA-directed RNA polymerase subunit delta [Syntrophomonadaceae bacterium]|jgi:DNA-directed RNA polymerase subunit delta|nr:DNA-directed RNA polymerase subunit delta [Syntrophomonadaceae bacterium]